MLKYSSKPGPNVKEIYDALGYKQYPFIKKSALPENEGEKIESANNQRINDSKLQVGLTFTNQVINQ